MTVTAPCWRSARGDQPPFLPSAQEPRSNLRCLSLRSYQDLASCSKTLKQNDTNLVLVKPYFLIVRRGTFWERPPSRYWAFTSNNEKARITRHRKIFLQRPKPAPYWSQSLEGLIRLLVTSRTLLVTNASEKPRHRLGWTRTSCHTISS